VLLLICSANSSQPSKCCWTICSANSSQLNIQVLLLDLLSQFNLVQPRQPNLLNQGG
jgi:hypothetical protein